MSVGGTRILKMPPDLAFGPDGEPGLGLPAGRDLIAIVELVGAW
jgi:FKBP-type peptidyl-prolyl cis-trans isomerase